MRLVELQPHVAAFPVAAFEMPQNHFIVGGSAVTASVGAVSLRATDDAVVRGMAGTLALD